jgi:hypothetical protein
MPIVHDGTILASASGMGVIALRPTRRDDAWDVALVWETKDVSMYISNPVVVDDVLFRLLQRASGQQRGRQSGESDLLPE